MQDKVVKGHAAGFRMDTQSHNFIAAVFHTQLSNQSPLQAEVLFAFLK